MAQKQNEYTLILFDRQGREISRIPSPDFILDSWRWVWALRTYKSRRNQDKRCDHWDLKKEVKKDLPTP